MKEFIVQEIKRVTGAREVIEGEVIQNLWSNYGQIVRCRLQGSAFNSVVVKHVKLPQAISHPRGWNSSISHERKIRSYNVETKWYEAFSQKCDDACRVPQCLAVDTSGDEVLIVLEDLDASGFALRKTSVSWEHIKNCLFWLAHFHATFLGVKAEGLWPTGTYWHLETRPEELKALDDVQLKNAAHLIDNELKRSAYQTIVHGDAKLANFCFSSDGRSVAAVDFQYTGAGCGMKDVAYFIGSCLDERQCETLEDQILDTYFAALKDAVKGGKSAVDPEELEAGWRPLYHVAWADFHRFLKGWSPGHWKINTYSEYITRQVITAVQNKMHQ